MTDQPAGESSKRKSQWRTIYFRLDSPEAKQVSVVGDFNDWKEGSHPLSRNADGVWECQMPLPAGRYAYAFLVDGERCADPNCPRREVAGDGTERCILDVSSPSGE